MEGAAGPSSSHQTAARRHRPRGGIKHRKKINSSPRDRRPPPAPSCEPCSFGCGCWFKHKCVFAHSDHDHQQWAHENELKTALIDIQATKLKARLAGRSARRSALSPLSNNSAPENTVVAHKKSQAQQQQQQITHPPAPTQPNPEEEVHPPLAGSHMATVMAAFTQAPAPSHTKEYDSDDSDGDTDAESSSPPSLPSHTAVVSAAVGPPPEPPAHHHMQRLDDGDWVQAEFTAAYFQHCSLKDELLQSDDGLHLLEHGSGMRYWIVRPNEDHTRIQMDQPDKHMFDIGANPSHILRFTQPELEPIPGAMFAATFTAEHIDDHRVRVRWATRTWAD